MSFKDGFKYGNDGGSEAMFWAFILVVIVWFFL